MKLNHINLTVPDVAATREFLEAYFGLRKVGGNNNLSVLFDDCDFVLTLSSMKLAHETEVRYPGIFHIGFSQASEEAVNELNRRLKADGFDVPPPSRQHGAWTFYFRAPGEFTIEVSSALDNERTQ